MRLLLIGLFLMGGCATAQKQVFLGDGESVIVEGVGDLKMVIGEDRVTIKSEKSVKQVWDEVESLEAE